MVTYQLQLEWLPPSLAGLAIAALFILPFLLFSATAGQATDKYDKTRVIRFVKNLEIAIMIVAAYGFWTTDVYALLGCVFLMGLHSTIFGPVKFAYLPQHLNERELTGGKRHGRDGYVRRDPAGPGRRRLAGCDFRRSGRTTWRSRASRLR